MNTPCNVILDLIPLVKDHVASEESIKLVQEHVSSCENCKVEFESHGLPARTEIDDKKVVSTIRKKLFIITSVLLLTGAFIGMALGRNTSSNLMPAIIAVLGIAFLGILVLKFDLKGDRSVRRFYIGKAVGTLIVFAVVGIYLLLKYGLHIF